MRFNWEGTLFINATWNQKRLQISVSALIIIPIIVLMFTNRLPSTLGTLDTFAGNKKENLQQGLVGYWKFNEGEGDITFDETANHYDITLGEPLIRCSAPAWVREGGINALFFDGKTSCMRLPDLPVFSSDSAFTVAFWIYSHEPNGEWSRIVSQEFLSENGWQGWRIYRHAEQNLIGFNRMRDGRGIPIYASFVPNMWHFFAFIFDGSERKIYRDGTLIASTASKEHIIEHDSPLIIARFSRHTQDFWNGMLSEVRIWNYALSQTEISTHMTNSSTFNHIAKVRP